MTAFVVLWWVVTAYLTFETIRAGVAVFRKPGTTVTFHWPFLILAGANTGLGVQYLLGVIR